MQGGIVNSLAHHHEQLARDGALNGERPACAGMLDVDSEFFAGMLGVYAMAVQNALVRVSLRGAPSTAVMTTNITLFTMDIVKILLQGDASGVAAARDRAGNTWPAIIGFLLGCALGAACETALGLRSLMLPATLALFAIALGLSAALQGVGATNSWNREQHDERKG